MTLTIPGIVPYEPIPNFFTYANSRLFSPKNFQQETVESELDAFKLHCADRNNPVLASFLEDDSRLASQSNHSIHSKKNPKKRAAPGKLEKTRIKVRKRQSKSNDAVQEAAASAIKVCSICNSTKNVRYKKKETKENQCERCYRKALAASSDKTCVDCETMKSYMWYKKKETQEDQCANCYRKALAASANKTCIDCDTMRSSRWRKKKGTKEDQCNGCYQKAICAVRKTSAAKLKNKNTETPHIYPFSPDSFFE